eukprot:15100702-Alexandrium_andersonii.AAC.1
MLAVTGEGYFQRSQEIAKRKHAWEFTGVREVDEAFHVKRAKQKARASAYAQQLVDCELRVARCVCVAALRALRCCGVAKTVLRCGASERRACQRCLPGRWRVEVATWCCAAGGFGVL